MTDRKGHPLVAPAPRRPRPRLGGNADRTRDRLHRRDGLRVVGGDGTGDRLLDRVCAGCAPAWDPARLHVLAEVAGGAVVLRRASTAHVSGARRWHPACEPRLVVGRAPARGDSPRRIVVLRSDGTRPAHDLDARGRSRGASSGPAPTTSQSPSATTAQARSSSSTSIGPARKLLFADGAFGESWSPARPLAFADWPMCEPVGVPARPHVRPVSNIAEQSRGRTTRRHALTRRAGGAAAASLEACSGVGDTFPEATVPRARPAGDLRRTRRGRAEAHRILSVRLVLHLHERAGTGARPGGLRQVGRGAGRRLAGFTVGHIAWTRRST